MATDFAIAERSTAGINMVYYCTWQAKKGKKKVDKLG